MPSAWVSVMASEAADADLSTPSAPTEAAPAMAFPVMVISRILDAVKLIFSKPHTCLNSIGLPFEAEATATRALGSAKAPEGMVCAAGTETLMSVPSRASPAEAGYTAYRVVAPSLTSPSNTAEAPVLDPALMLKMFLALPSKTASWSASSHLTFCSSAKSRATLEISSPVAVKEVYDFSTAGTNCCSAISLEQERTVNARTANANTFFIIMPSLPFKC